jgi:uncharacterized repeat protein (TIGR03847 family)
VEILSKNSDGLEGNKMSRIVYHHPKVDRFIVGTIGQPGERQFFIQVRSENGLNTMAIEKSQVIALTERFEQMIVELRRSKMATISQLSESIPIDDQPLESPIEQDFQIGIIAISWEKDHAVVNIQAVSQLEELILDDLSDAPDLVTLNLVIGQVKAFCDRAKVVIGAGRPACPFCSLPIDPTGHLCPRANGYRR